jgi:hypothetical protein
MSYRKQAMHIRREMTVWFSDDHHFLIKMLAKCGLALFLQYW